MKNRELPTLTLSGTIFLVDVSKNELRQQYNPENRISIFEMRDTETGYAFEYDVQSKNAADTFSESADQTTITIPYLVDLDPIGMAEKHGFSPEEIKGKPIFR